MKKSHSGRLLGLLLCAALIAAGAALIKAELNSRAAADSESILLDAGAMQVDPGQAAQVTIYGEDGALLSRQQAVASQGRLLVRLTRAEFSDVSGAEAVLLDRETGEAVGEPSAVELNEYAGLTPGDVYRPGKIGKETISYQLQDVPVYRGTEKNPFSAGDFRWSEEHDDRLEAVSGAADFGIDVSAHQNRASRNGEIDWDAVKADGVNFVMVRAGFRGTETGALREDLYFRQNLQGAMEAGLDVGVYFFSQAVTVEEALEEADFVLELLRDQRISGPVAFDWEMDDPAYRVHGAVTPEMATACAVSFCQRIRGAGFEPLIYTSRQVGYLMYDQGAVAQYGCWYPEYKGPDSAGLSPDYFYRMDYWQFSDRCRVDGIGGPVDGNLRFY